MHAQRHTQHTQRHTQHTHRYTNRILTEAGPEEESCGRGGAEWGSMGRAHLCREGRESIQGVAAKGQQEERHGEGGPEPKVQGKSLMCVSCFRVYNQLSHLILHLRE